MPTEEMPVKSMEELELPLPRVMDYTIWSSKASCPSPHAREGRTLHGGQQQQEQELVPHKVPLFSMTVRLLGMDSLHGLQGSGLSQCPIALQAFDKATVDFLPEDSSFIEGRPDLCIASLPCGHHFHALSLLCNMALASMRCPICRCVCVCATVKRLNHKIQV
jgi:hypothetical protein